MTLRAKTRTERHKAEGYEIHVRGAPRAPLRDFYHALLQLSWPLTLAVIVLAYLGANTVFAAVFVTVGGIQNARPGSFADAFFFSVQTMGTIGYGGLLPQSTAANVVVVCESVVGLLLTAVSTGLVFAKFSRPTARVLFSKRAVIGAMNGVPTLSFRVGNLRSNRLIEAEARVTYVFTERTKEGKTFYRMIDLPLARARNASLARSWTLLHPIDEKSPLFGVTQELFARGECELHVTITGIDDIWMQTIHAEHQYFARDVLFDRRLVDVLSENEDGTILTLDLTKFHDVEPDEDPK